MMFTQHNDDVCMIMKFLSNAPIIFVSANTQLPAYLSQSIISAATAAAAGSSPSSPSPAHFQQCVVTISSKHEFSVNKYNPSAAQPSPSNAINNYTAYTDKPRKASSSNSSSKLMDRRRRRRPRRIRQPSRRRRFSHKICRRLSMPPRWPLKLANCRLLWTNSARISTTS